ncbi:helix-turn-helix transcriptional regulator [Halomonas gemina]|uniref:helix-turn-helix transcriptional regulator n=1 Tax=Halomonas gemina TaxID=2945105 RepID=UPI0024C42650|nr:AlpA family phage regulatory protein [Halomonas gemina]
MKTQNEIKPLYLKVSRVAAREDVSIPTIWRWVRIGHFPQPVELGHNTTRWRLSDIEAWEAERPMKEIGKCSTSTGKILN